MAHISQEHLSAAQNYLDLHGFGLFAAVAWRSLPAEVQAALRKADAPLDQYPTLLMIGNAGLRFWEALQASDPAPNDPVDTWSATMMERTIDRYFNAIPAIRLFPSSAPIPLQQLGRAVNWHHDSPLGLGINSTYGLWWAYRAVYLIDATIPDTRLAATASPCDTCVDKPCMTHCPVGAVKGIGRFDIPLCASNRVPVDSQCEFTCFARLACPVAAEHRYSAEQMRHHYGSSLHTLRRWFPEAEQSN